MIYALIRAVIKRLDCLMCFRSSFWNLLTFRWLAAWAGPTKLLIEKSLKQTKMKKKRSGWNQNPNPVAVSLIYILYSLPLVSQLDIKLCITQVPSKSHVKAGHVDCNFDILDIYSFYVKVSDTNGNGGLREVFVCIKFQHESYLISVSGESFRHQININQITPDFFL